MVSFLYACIFSAFWSTVIASSPICIHWTNGQPAVDRSTAAVKFARNDWVSHQVVSTIVDILCREVLGYAVEAIRPETTRNWGPALSSREYDLDVENWFADESSEEYQKYVRREESVLDAGLIGYSGRVGLYTMRRALAQNGLADYYKLYQNATQAHSLDIPFFKELQSVHNMTEPSRCEANFTFCSGGDLAGYWAPPVCENNPESCVEIMHPLDDGWQDFTMHYIREGYFEQLVKETGVQAVIGYYTWNGIGDHLIDQFIRPLHPFTPYVGHNALFVWYEPQPLIATDVFGFNVVDAVRVRFPDHYMGCDDNYISDPSQGRTACDPDERVLRKLASTTMRQSFSDAYLSLALLTLDRTTIEQLLLRTYVSDVFSVSCEFVQQIYWGLPNCLRQPKTYDLPVLTAVERFNDVLLVCENQTILHQVEPTLCFDSGDRPGTVNRSQEVIYVARRNWLSQELTSIITEILLRDYLGYTVVSVYHIDGESGLDTREDLASGLLDVDIENWMPERTEQYYASGEVHFAGNLGFSGREGLYVTRAAVEKNNLADYYKYFRNATSAYEDGFLLHSESLLPQFFNETLPCGSGDGLFDWCQNLTGYWAPSECRADPDSCLEVAMEYPGWGLGLIEQMVQNNQVQAVLAYYGSSLRTVISQLQISGSFIPFYAFEPSPVLIRYDAQRIAFPIHWMECSDRLTVSVTGGATCDVPSVSIDKSVSKKVLTLKEALFTLETLELTSVDINSLIARHVDAGGPLATAGEVACEFVQNNPEKIRTWAPDCMVRPPTPEDTRVNDTVFSQNLGRCYSLSCKLDEILTYSDSFNAFQCEHCRDGEVPAPDQRSCVFCADGEHPSADGQRCEECPPGQFALARSAECAPCLPGTYAASPGHSECDLCPLGRSESDSGSTECVMCGAGEFSDEAGTSACSLCAAGDFKPGSGFSERLQNLCTACGRGQFSVYEGATACEECAFGTTNILGAHSPDFCICPERQFFFNASGEQRCIPCNEFMEPCRDGEVAPRQLAGYHVSVDAANVYRCASEDACPAGPLGTCGEGGRGRGCADCEEGEYVWNGDKCAKCGADDSLYVFLLPVAAIFILAVTYRYGNDPVGRRLSSTSEFLVLLGLSLNIFFYLNSFAGFDIDWREPLKSFIEVCAQVSGYITAIHLSCSLKFGNVAGYIFSSLVPAIILLVFSAMGLAKLAMPRKLFNTAATCTYALYLLLVLHGLKPFRYIVHPRGGNSVLDMPDVFEDSDEHAGLIICGLCVLLLYCLPFAVACVYATYRVSKVQKNSHLRWWLLAFRFLFYKFQPRSYYWGVYILARNAIFALAPSLAPTEPKVGVFALTLVASLSVACTALVCPWRHLWMSVVDVLILCYMLLVLNLAAGWVRISDGADAFLANFTIASGGLACAAALGFVIYLIVGLACSSAEDLQKKRNKEAEKMERYVSDRLGYFQNPDMEYADSLDQLANESRDVQNGHFRPGSLAWPLATIKEKETQLDFMHNMAESMEDPDYDLQHFYLDCIGAFPELKLYDVQAMTGAATTHLGQSHGVATERISGKSISGITLAEEQQRTIGALFAVYCLCRLKHNGKQIMSFGVDADRPRVVRGPPAGVDLESLNGMPWGKMNAAQRRVNFYHNFDWALMESLLLQSGIMREDKKRGKVLDTRRDGRLVAMLSLTAFHDIMKDRTLCPVVHGEPYEGYRVGETIHDHDIALAYLLDRHPNTLPSYRVLTAEQKALIRFTQNEMGFNAGWLVQAEGPPSAVLRKLKAAITKGGVRDHDVAFYFVHWVTDLAGAEPTPFAGSEKFAVKFPPFVLQGLLGCFSIVRMLADYTETEVYEAYLRERWLAMDKISGDKGLPTGPSAIAKMRLLCMSQGGASAVLGAWDRISEADRKTLIKELSETGMPGQQYSEWKVMNPNGSGTGAGTPFLLYYGPAWCQRIGQTHPELALKVLAKVFRLSRLAYPESLHQVADVEEDILYRTILVGVLKTIDVNMLENDIQATGETGGDEIGDSFIVVERDTHLEGALNEAFCF